jgi:hypothetical protein
MIIEINGIKFNTMEAMEAKKVEEISMPTIQTIEGNIVLGDLFQRIIQELQDLEEELDSPEEQYEENEAFLDHYVELLMENAKCKNCTRDILMNFMDEIIYKMN